MCKVLVDSILRRSGDAFLRPPVLLNYLIDSQLLITGREGEMEVVREEFLGGGKEKAGERRRERRGFAF